MRNRWCRELAAVVIGSAVVLAAAEAGAQNPPQNFVQGQCSNYRVSPTSASVRVAGGSGRFQIQWDWQAPPSNGVCTFACTSNACGEVTGNVTSSASWLTASKQGVWVNYTAAGNTGTSRRSATVTVIGQTFTVRQGGCPPSPAVTPNPLTLPAGGGRGTLTVYAPASCRYSVRDNRSWLSVTPSTVAGNGTVTVTATRNTGSAERRGTVTVGSRSVTVIQPPPCPSAPSVSPSSLSVGSGRGSTTVRLQEASSCSYTVTDNRSWLGVSPSTVAGNATVTVTFTANTSTSSRSGTVRIGARNVGLTQCPSAPSVSPSSLSVGSGRGSTTVTLQEASSCSYTVSDNRSWLGVSPSTVAGNATVTVTFTANTSSSSRSGTVRIGTRNVGLTQSPPCPSAPSVSPSPLSVGSGRGSTTVTLQEASSCSYTVSDNRSWLGVSPSTVAGNATVTVTFTANTSSSSRSGTVRIGTRNVGLTQSPPCPSAPSVSPSSLSVGSGRGSTTVTLQEASSCSYTVSDNRSWLGVSPSTVAGNATVTVTFTDNTGTNSRSGTVTIGTRSVSITQSHTSITCPNAPSVSSAALTLGRSSGSAMVRLQEASACSYSVSDNQDWLTVTPSTVAGNGTVTVTVTANSGTNSRSGTVTIGTRGVSVSQGARPTTSGPNPGPGPETPAACGPAHPTETLEQSRDRLICDWARRKDKRNDCQAWNSLTVGAKWVFIWNTHRLHKSGMGDSTMLRHVTKLYSITGQKDEPAPNEDDEGACGGEGYNRTFMSMTPSLQAALLNTISDVDADNAQSTVPHWRKSHDPTCYIDALPGTCPHPPFWFQTETRSDGPTGQIQFFDATLVVVERDHYQGLGLNPVRRIVGCGKARKRIRLTDVCTTGACAGDSPIGSCHTTTYSDRIVRRPSDPYNIPKDGQRVEDAYSFEMDQDYSSPLPPIRIHQSAPRCYNMKYKYAARYGDPDWNWRPSACEAAHQPGAAFTFDSLGSESIRAVDTVELRARIDGLRSRFGLTAFVWTDSTIDVGVTPVKAVHVTELRTALQEVYVAAKRDAPLYTDTVIRAGVTPVRATHLTELRAAVVALEQ